MKKKIVRGILLGIFAIIIIVAIFNTYKCIVTGNQIIRISTSTEAYSNEDLYVSIIALDEDSNEVECSTKITLLDSNENKVKNVEVVYDENTSVISIPEVESGTYYIKAKVKSEVGTDTVQKKIYIYNGETENVTISLDKGIYKPGDTVNFRALLTSQDDDEPVDKDVNVSIYDGNGNKVYTEDTTTSNYGIISGSFDLADEVNSGTYKIVVTTNTNETTKQFKVNPYVTPKYELTVDYDKTTYTVGETAQITMNAEYFFGEAVEYGEFTLYVNDEAYRTYISDQDGNATATYKFTEAGTYTFKVEAVDSSNYYVEESETITVGTDIFEIELLPEYGVLVAGMKNNVYVFTKTADGTPVKTYVTVSSDDFTKQIATDENGIGKFQIDVDAISSSTSSVYSYYYNSSTTTSMNFNITAQDMEGEEVTTTISCSIQTKSLLVTTDNVKYEQGDDITVSAISTSDKTKNIYFVKNNKVIKMVSTDSDEVTVNLDDVYGLIDVYVTEYVYRSGSSVISSKRTIFITPEKTLSVAITTDEEEYEPGDNITISFTTTDENSSNVEAALLVSMIDNQVLSLASNDLSIDNIKLALSGISFSDDLDAATLYTCIVNDESEQTLMGLLLRQSDTDISVSDTSVSNSDEEETANIIAIVAWVIVGVIVIITLIIKIKALRKLIVHLPNVLIFGILLGTTIFPLLYTLTNTALWSGIITAVLGLSIYIAAISRIFDKINRTSISIGISLLIAVLVMFVIEVTIEFDSIIGIVVLCIALGAILGLAIASRIKKLENSKFWKKVSKETIYILKYLGAVILSIIIGLLIKKIITISLVGSMMGYIVGVVLVYVFNYLFNIRNKKQDDEADGADVSERKQSTAAIVGIIIVILVLLFVGSLVIMVYNSAKSMVSDASLDASIVEDSDGFVASNSSSSGIMPSDIIGSSKSTTSSSTQSNEDSTEIATVTEEIATEETTSDEEETIRNLFLESMCFIPELITENGQASLELQLSDNITTWTIQTVGNTLDGRVGYGIIDNIKVSKDFFIDFDLPNNLVVGDTVSIPITIYNYTEDSVTTTLKVEDEDWFTLNDDASSTVKVEANSTELKYISITITESGENKFRAEGNNGTISDIVEKTTDVNPNGYKVEQVVSTGTLSEDVSEDILILEDIVDGSASATVKIYSSAVAQTIEGMENIFKMPTGCFEQISSSLYPNILALKYLEDTGTVNEEIRQTALDYISTGYQKLLTYEVQGETGGYSLYGKSPASTALTAYGLMELTDLSEVYSVDENVLNNMTEFLYGKQNSDGSFELTGKTSFEGDGTQKSTLALNAYIIWALSESNPEDTRIDKSVEYLKDNIDNVEDNYTLALIANILANVGDNDVDSVMKTLANNITVSGNSAYITSNLSDCYGTRSNYQTIQTVALTSMAFSKTSYNATTNSLLINYLVSQKDTKGTWYTTHATILALKAINELNDSAKLENQTIKVTVNSETQEIEIGDDPLSIYTVTFDGLSKENTLNIDIDGGKAYYEVIEEYYIPWENVTTEDDEIEVSVSTDTKLNVNDVLTADIQIINNSSNDISNGMVTISIPQGFTVDEDSLLLLETDGLIEKYETSYTEINLYLQDFQASEMLNLSIEFRASYPVSITGLSVRAYDYYNPEVEGKSKPIKIEVSE